MSRKIASDAKTRFSSRVQNYIKYRPHYPAAIVPFLTGTANLKPTSQIADIGSGTGILSELFLKNGNTVYGVEPNDEMRAAAERLLGEYAHFISVNGAAEATTLASNSVDLVVAGQAFHWFELEPTRAECRRILKRGGWVGLIWNERKADAIPLMQSYEDLLHTYGLDYEQVSHKKIDRLVLDEFFEGPDNYRLEMLVNYQVFDLESLKGRLLSSSYAPPESHPNYAPMMSELEKLFRQFEEDGLIKFEYDTRLFYGQL